MDDPKRSESRDSVSGDTSRRLREALGGDAGAVSWLVERFDPVLYAAACHQLGPSLRRHFEPHDLVMDVWAVALRRLPELELADAPCGKRFVAFLSATMRNLVNDLLRRSARLGIVAAPAGHDEPPACVTSVTGAVTHRELRERFAAVLEELSADDRELVVLRGLEQLPYEDIARVVDAAPGHLAVRYHRALEKLRRKLPSTLLEELGD